MSGDVRSLEEVIAAAGAKHVPVATSHDDGAYVTCEACEWHYDGADWPSSVVAHLNAMRAAAVREWCLAPQQIAAVMEEMGHYQCEDCWYSCPESADGSCCEDANGNAVTGCTCNLRARARAVLQAVMNGWRSSDARQSRNPPRTH